MNIILEKVSLSNNSILYVSYDSSLILLICTFTPSTNVPWDCRIAAAISSVIMSILPISIPLCEYLHSLTGVDMYELC